jgi:hypothetical protein
MAAFIGKAWFRAQIAPYLNAIKAAIAQGGGGAAPLQEFVDSNKPNPQHGDQWIRLDTIAPPYSPTHLAPLGLIQNRSAVRRKGTIRTQTSIGVIST